MGTRQIVYLALGERRSLAARRLTAEAAEDAADVRLIVPATPAWADLDLPGVTVTRVPGPVAAQRLLTGPGAPERGATLVAGDPAAMPVVWSVARRRPDLQVATEPAGVTGRRPAVADLAVLAPWYPGPNDDFAGAFVRATTSAVRGLAQRILTVHTEGWFFPDGPASPDAIDAAAERFAERGRTVAVLDTPLGETVRIAVPSHLKRGYASWIDAHVRALRAALPTGRIEAPVVHAHTGVYAGVQAAALARPDARVVVTEHATFLPKVFRHAGARRRYAAMLRRADVVLCVSASLRDYLAGRFPEHAAKFRVVPNPIDFDGFHVRPAAPVALRRWLYLGRLIEHKGVRTLLEAFALVAAEDPEPTLTLVGSGPLEEPLRARAAELGLGDRVRLLPAVPPERVAGLMHEHDLLVHLSRMETFGMTVVEAVASGLPVLVAASEGPSETLAGLNGTAGSLIEITEDPVLVAEAYRKLAARLPELDLPAARVALRERYGNEAVAAQLRRWYFDPVETPGVVSAAEPRPGRKARLYAALLSAARKSPDLRPEIALRRSRRIVGRALARAKRLR